VTGDPAALLRGQKRDDVNDVLRFANAGERGRWRNSLRITRWPSHISMPRSAAKIKHHVYGRNVVLIRVAG
jgi:hypothetical protein